MIIPNDSRRARSKPQRPPALARAGARQMRSSESCNSPNTVVAPNSSRAMPMTVPTMPCAGLLTLASRPCTAVAASLPMRPWSCPNSSPRTASSPNTRPATETTISSSGASENTV